jgi:signal transduction histidine kinase/CheY-like chemotaxis protein
MTPHISESERLIRRIYQITNEYDKGLEFQIIELLKLGLERFNLDIAILSNIEDGNYTVVHCVTPEGVELNPGDEFELGITYCNITCTAKAPVAIEHMGEHDKYSSHPAYAAFQLESYIGVPIRVNNRLFGTLNFSSPTPYPRKFEEVDIDALQLMARWIEVELHRAEQEHKLKQANQYKTEFLSNMSHEIRTPMNGIMGALKLLTDTKLTDKQSRLVSLALSSSRTLGALLNDILDISKIEAGKIELSETPFELDALAEEIVGAQRLKLTSGQVQLNYRFDQVDQYHLLGDELRLKQILNNLISNAIKFTNQGTVSLTVSQLSTEQVKDRNVGCFRFAVTDTGIGLTEAQAHKLFERFAQADKSTTRKYGGTGLGLSISKSLVELMGGNIGVHSEYGKGATFWFTLPLTLLSAKPDIVKSASKKSDGHHSDRNHSERTHAHSSQPHKATNQLKQSTSHTLTQSSTHVDPQLKGHVLLVEDNDINQQIAEGFLEQLGLSYDVATNGQEALDMIQRSSYKLVLMDCLMPIMDGYQATHEIRKLPSPLNTLPVLALTANALSSDIKKCYQAGMDDHISKPIDMAELESKLKAWL